MVSVALAAVLHSFWYRAPEKTDIVDRQVSEFHWGSIIVPWYCSSYWLISIHCHANMKSVSFWRSYWMAYKISSSPMTNAWENRFIVRLDLQNRIITSPTIIQEMGLFAASPVSPLKVRLRLQHRGLSARWSLLRFPLTMRHRQRPRLLWAEWQY